MRTTAEKVVEGGFTFPLNIICVDGSGKGYLAVIRYRTDVDGLAQLAKSGALKLADGELSMSVTEPGRYSQSGSAISSSIASVE